ncbi:MAG: DUF6350 family protein [Tetrasphaera sp.]
MTVLEMLRRPRWGATSATPAGPPRPWLRPLLGGAAAAATTLLVMLVLVAGAGTLAAKAELDWGDAFGFGAASWLLAGGARLVADSVVIGFTPLLGFAALVLSAIAVGRRFLPRSGRRLLPYLGWIGGYAAVALLAALLTLAGSARPAWTSLAVPVLGVPALALAVIEGRRGRLDDLLHRLPRTLRRCVRPAVRTLLVALTCGMLLVLAAVLAHFGSVSEVYRLLDTGALGGGALTAAQVLAWPNLGIWALSLAAGPGYSLTEGTAVTLGGATGGVVPALPVFAASPGPGDFGWPALLLVVIPILLGAYAARRTLAEIPRLASGRVKLGGVATTVALVVVTLAALDVLAGGSLGVGRLRHVGVSAPALALALAAWMSLGAGLTLLRDWWRLRR